jgi:hypothetical protein
MSLSNELSNEIAVALMAAKAKYPGEPKDLKELIFKVHNALQRLTEDSRSRRQFPEAKTPNVITNF